MPYFQDQQELVAVLVILYPICAQLQGKKRQILAPPKRHMGLYTLVYQGKFIITLISKDDRRWYLKSCTVYFYPLLEPDTG
jgi:hypothetical protein